MTLLQTWIDYVADGETATERGPDNGHESKSENDVPATTLIYFASTSLDLRQTDKPDGHPEDIFVEGVCYRIVDPPYFAWLRRRMETAKRKFEAGQLPETTWENLRTRFNGLQEWAIGHYGKKTLQATIRSFDAAGYTPPVNCQPEPYLFPKTGDWKSTEPDALASIRKVDAIREAAQAKGWSDERLYQNRGRFSFPLGQDYGLVCFVGPDDELGEITETHIEIIHDCAGRKNSLRFANSDVFPPRIRKADSAS